MLYRQALDSGHALSVEGNYIGPGRSLERVTPYYVHEGGTKGDLRVWLKKVLRCRPSRLLRLLAPTSVWFAL